MSDAARYVVRDLDGQHDALDAFTCGEPSLDAWLRGTAVRAHRAGAVRVRLLWRRDDGALVGYYATCPTEIRRDEVPLPSRARAGASTVSGFLLARLAVAAHAQGAGLGRDLLVDALEHICAAADLAGGRVVVVDPVDASAAAFYAHFGFQAVRGHTRLFLLVQDARASLATR